MRRNNYHNKIPPFTPDPEHFTRMQRLWKAKVAYESEDDACGDIIPLVYTCKDCFFFKNDICHNTTEKRYTSEENPSCRDFEYKEIKVEL